MVFVAEAQGLENKLGRNSASELNRFDCKLL